MDESYDDQGFLVTVRGKFAYERSVSLTKYNDTILLHLNDSSKCWNNGNFDKTKAKSISINWKGALALSDCLAELKPFAEQIGIEQVSHFLTYIYFKLYEINKFIIED